MVPAALEQLTGEEETLYPELWDDILRRSNRCGLPEDEDWKTELLYDGWKATSASVVSYVRGQLSLGQATKLTYHLHSIHYKMMLLTFHIEILSCLGIRRTACTGPAHCILHALALHIVRLLNLNMCT